MSLIPNNIQNEVVYWGWSTQTWFLKWKPTELCSLWTGSLVSLPPRRGRGRGRAGMIFPYGLSSILRSWWFSVNRLPLSIFTPANKVYKKSSHCLDVWKATCLHAAEHPVYPVMCVWSMWPRADFHLTGLPARACCWWGLLSVPLWSLSTGIFFFFHCFSDFEFIHANMSKHHEPRAGTRQGGRGRGGGAGRRELVFVWHRTASEWCGEGEREARAFISPDLLIFLWKIHQQLQEGKRGGGRRQMIHRSPEPRTSKSV